MNASLAPLAQVDWSGQLRTLAARFGDRIAARDGEAGTMSYAEFSARAHAVAVHLLAQGLHAGTPVASLLPNSLEAIWVSFGIKLAGLCEVPLGWGYTADEIRWCAQVSGAKVLITREARVALAGEAGLHPMMSADIALHDRGGALSPVPGPTPGRILFTSGTTGRPKGVLASHGRRWVGEQLQKACLPFMPQPGSKILLMTPFVHGSGLLSAAWFDCGGEITLHDGVDPARVRPLLESGNYEAMFAPPTVLAKLVGAFDGASLPGLRCIFTGTQPLARGLYERARQMFGPVVRVTYGKTECINPITTLTFTELDEAFAETPAAGGSCTGWPAPGVEIRIGHPHESPRATGEEDEAWLRASQQSDGLITADGFRPHEPDGWHATGDLGLLDSRGRLWLTGRVADVIKTGGYRVNPDEVESALAGMRTCAQAAITSLPSDYWGEIIIAVIEQPRDGWREELESRASILSRHKRPRLFVEMTALPRNPQGKVSRKKLRETVLARHTLIDGPYPVLEAMS